MKYDFEGQKGLEWHEDGAEISFNIALNQVTSMAFPWAKWRTGWIRRGGWSLIEASLWRAPDERRKRNSAKLSRVRREALFVGEYVGL